MRTLLLTTSAFVVLAAPAFAQETRVLDSFDRLSGWEADASTDVTSRVSSVPGRSGGQALRLDYDFNGRAGYAFAAKPLTFDLPDNYEISFWVRGAGPTNTFEVKFTDAANENVWWRQMTRYDFPGDWSLFTIKRRQIDKAWGPSPERVLTRAERMEFVVVAAEGGAGFVEVDELTLRELPPEPAVPPRPVVSASSAQGSSVAALAVDGDPQTGWRSGPGVQSLTLDLGYEREFGGVTLRWADKLHASAYTLMASDDGRDWAPLRRVTEGDGGTDWIRTTEASARWLRLDLQSGPGEGYALNEIEVEPLSHGEDLTSFVAAVADEAVRGFYPRGFHGEQPYWTLVGVDGGGESGLMGEDGAVELRRGGPTIEPFVMQNGRLITWADVSIGQTLRDDYLPIPSVTWTHRDWTLDVTSFAEGRPDEAGLWTRYVLTNTSNRPETLTLALMARPLQVNGPRQFLAVPGGASPIRQLDWNGASLVLNDAIRVHPLVQPDRIAASTFDAGSDPRQLLASDRRHAPSERVVVSDDTDLVSGAMLYEVTLQPGESRTFGFLSPLSGALEAPRGEVAAQLDAAEARVAAEWREKLERFDMTLPPQAQRIEHVLRSSLAHMLMSRQGPILQPGTRSYNRSWIRDGAMMAEGLNRLGLAELSAEYLRWFAPYVFENGKVPCCVDARGADPVPENDSHGEFIFLAAEVHRYTGDTELLRSVWPQVEGAIRYMDELRAETKTAEYQTPRTRHMYGLLPATISHEGYADKPAYSYWDDFWGLLGYKDAVYIAEALGETEAAARFAAARDAFQRDIMASIEATAAFHGIDYIAGAADRGDFDATSTTIGLSPAGALADLPQPLLNNTFDQYWRNFEDRRANRIGWNEYTPYELRVVGAFVRLGQRERAIEALDYFFADMRPRAWNGWAEVVHRDERRPLFIGDMPHAWISSDYIRSALDLFAYERDSDQALVLAAGVPTAWLETEEGVGVRGLRTAHGPLGYAFRRERGAYVLTLEPGANPPGGFVVRWPGGETPPARVTVDGRPAAFVDGELALPAATRRVEMR